MNEEHGILKGNIPPAYDHNSVAIFQQDGDRRSIGMFPTVCEKATASSHHSSVIKLLTQLLRSKRSVRTLRIIV